MNNSLLSICIPTYNRANILDEALDNLICKINKYNFEIIISDNASTDNTPEIVKKHKEKNPNIIYFRQESNILDKNFITCYNLSTSKYIWILGDSSRIYSEHLDEIIELIYSEKYDAIVMNAHNRIKNINSKEYQNPEALMAEIGWQIGLISSTIVSKKMTTEEYVWRYRETNFIHFGLVFEYLCKNPETKVYWLNKHVATHTKLNKTATSWLPRSLEIYGKGYMAFVLSLPSQISTDTKLKCIKDHSLNQGIFEFKNICAMRSKNWLKYSDVKKYKYFLPFLTNTPTKIIFIISILPRFIFQFLHKIYHLVRKTEHLNYLI
jgi:Glycosyltransferases involved in cell wall biogenesis